MCWYLLVFKISNILTILFFSGKYDLQFTQSVLSDNYSIVLQQDCPIYIINVKQNVVMSI